jgi:hypothetical protein
MLKSLLATTALASALAAGAYAQTAADPVIEDEGPAAEAPAEVKPDAQTAQDPEASHDTDMVEDPAAPEADTAADPAATPESETAEDPAVMPESEAAEDPAAMPEADTAQDPSLAPADPSVAAEPVLTPIEDAAVSADTLIGANIQTPEGENIATVNDVLLTPDGAVESVVAQFGGFLGFGSTTVLVTMDEIDVYEDEAGNIVVQSSLTPEALEGRPEYVPEPEGVEG